jgi:hypothetical protein
VGDSEIIYYYEIYIKNVYSLPFQNILLVIGGRRACKRSRSPPLLSSRCRCRWTNFISCAALIVLPPSRAAFSGYCVALAGDHGVPAGAAQGARGATPSPTAATPTSSSASDRR